jgi:hypothetical protein
MRGIANGHRRHSAIEWRGIIERYRQSGLGINEFCVQEGVTVGTFELWYRRYRRTEPCRGQFVEVKPPGVAGLWAVEVELPGGTIVRLRG